MTITFIPTEHVKDFPCKVKYNNDSSCPRRGDIIVYFESQGLSTIMCKPCFIKESKWLKLND